MSITLLPKAKTLATKQPAKESFQSFKERTGAVMIAIGGKCFDIIGLRHDEEDSWLLVEQKNGTRPRERKHLSGTDLLQLFKLATFSRRSNLTCGRQLLPRKSVARPAHHVRQ